MRKRLPTRETTLRWARRIGIGLGVLLLLFVMFLALTPQGRAAYNTALFISQVVPGVPSLTLFQPDSIRERVTIDTPGGPREADIYRPDRGGTHAAAVVFLGVAPAGPEDSRLVRLGEALARARMVTLVFWSPDKLDERIHPPDIENLVAAFQYLRAQPFVDPERVGFGGFCVGASFVLMAAAQPEIRDDVAFINAFGPYYDLEDLLYAFGTRTRMTGNGPEPWDIDPLTQRVVRGMLLDSLALDDADLVRDALRTLETEMQEGSPEARAVHRFLAGGTEAELDAVRDDMPQEILDLALAASPRYFLHDVLAPVSLMHDRADDLVPAWESHKAYAALGHRDGVRFTEFQLFEHVDPAQNLGPIATARELGKLFGHLYSIMRRAQ